MMEFVSWDDDIPDIWKNKSHVPNHQSDLTFSGVYAKAKKAF